MQRPKLIRRKDFEAVLAENYRPIVLEGDARPEFARGIPQARIIGSGEELFMAPPYPNPRIRGARLIGGIDVWREVTDDPVPWNKDWYAVVESPSDPEYLYAIGPQKDHEHWSKEIPARYQGIKVVVL